MEMEKQGYSGFERFMFFVTPILFTLILLGVLVTLFNFDLRNKALEIGNTIPFLNRVIPEPAAEGSQAADEDAVKSANTTAKITELRAQLTTKETELTKAAEDKAKLTKSVKELQSQIDQLKQANTEKQLDDAAYQSKVGELATMYAKIAPSKAAPILESMELEEAVLVLDAMKPDDRVNILEKMSPKKAADVTVMLKDVKTAKDREIAALQARIKKQDTSVSQTPVVLSNTQLNSTFSKMDAKSAADLLLKMADVSPSKVLRILNAVDDAPRSKIIGEMSAANKDVTAQLVSKLMTGK
ncbi:magnesium transporter MgtE N-terminal domain-containing protein [Paenibacillus sp. R14(2021)]|uniref:magnesium transporter MgtE N-terminal domain-containing protein n=1 Tax=Paenibacillus sp. R14(2021) TaxID=2859228 RepID=UPI0021573CE4|nr:MgtE protein [Paenibacillus sp. R14(2021)]